jgi:phage repressor protein C with HTH and peptisase S24 domain
MSLKHHDIWRAIDQLAERNGLSPSGLALKAGLSSTVFNVSKRASRDRKRWPSTESIAQILQATGTSLDEFMTLVAGETGARATVPLIPLGQASRAGTFNEDGKPSGRGWEEMRFPGLDPDSFAIEVTGKGLEPVYREGDRIAVSTAEKPRRGDRVVVRTTKGEILVRQLGRDNANRIELVSLNPERAALSVTPRDIDWIYRIIWASQ